MSRGNLAMIAGAVLLILLTGLIGAVSGLSETRQLERISFSEP